MAQLSEQVKRHIHFVGIGGIGMSGIARLFLCRGARVSGSDLKENKITAQLKKEGADVFTGHDAANISGADLVVYSSAIAAENPEIAAAKKQGVSLIKRAQALSLLMQDKITVTVAGSHGKTTTTSLVSCLLLEAGLNPTVAIGGILKNIDNNACSGEGEFFVAEADESDGSFLYYKPRYSIVTNIDREHLDYYGDFENEVAAFGKFIRRTGEGGCLFCCNDDAALKRILNGYRGKYVLFGLSEEAQVYPRNISVNGLNSEFDCYRGNKLVSRFCLSLAGRHNISNALAVIALGLELGIEVKVIKRVLSEYKGAGRRTEIKFKNDQYLVIDDYAHHPAEIKATLAALRDVKPGRIIAVFQPHRFSRTKLLLEEFGRSFGLADYVIISDIYPAGELPIEGVSAVNILDKIKEHSPAKEAIYLPKEEISAHILRIMRPQDLVVTLGAGDIVRVCDELVEKIKG
ncbi:MAG: UDP-N-acetylmuramate--L-alanine ligase [Candidatus Omnitrophica bacterium]|nr:UDP-N-acetylmuramate--L-alanine ligase [Candidatus Omnitrophota bacterium]